MTVPAKLYLDEDQRAAERTVLDAAATVRLHDRPIDAKVHVLSSTGCLLSCRSPLQNGQPLSVGIAGLGMIPARVAHVSPNGFGCAFLTPIADGAASRVGAETVVPFDRAEPYLADAAQYLPMSKRLMIIAAASLTCWAVILGIASLIF